MRRDPDYGGYSASTSAQAVGDGAYARAPRAESGAKMERSEDYPGRVMSMSRAFRSGDRHGMTPLGRGT